MTFNLRLIPLLPFLGAAILMLFGRKWSRDTVVAVAAGVIAGACLVALRRLLHGAAGGRGGAGCTTPSAPGSPPVRSRSIWRSGSTGCRGCSA